MKFKKKLMLLMMCGLVLFLFTSFDFLTLLGLPSDFQMIEGNQESLEPNLLFWAEVDTSQRDKLKINGEKLSEEGFKVNLNDQFSLQAATTGKYELDFKLFGLIPLRKMAIDVIPRAKVMPGGHSIGLALQSEGVMVVKDSYVKNKADNKVYPAREAGIEAGDIILRINNKTINNKQELARLINHYGSNDEMIKLELKKQNGKKTTKTIKAVKSNKGYYMIGLYVDDGASGVGTISFYEPQTGYYGALGHMVTESNTQLGINVDEGEIYEANISGIKRSEQGVPGEKLGSFFKNHNLLGNIEKNNDFGVFGELKIKPSNPYFKEKIPVATPIEVEEGTAKAYTVISGSEIKEFSVEIEKVNRQYSPQKKGMIIRINDPKILRKTGGIVQGMSGSPIVQNGKLVGAITHVFVNDSAMGYAIFAQWMLMQTQILEKLDNTRELAA